MLVTITKSKKILMHYTSRIEERGFNKQITQSFIEIGPIDEEI